MFCELVLATRVANGIQSAKDFVSAFASMQTILLPGPLRSEEIARHTAGLPPHCLRDSLLNFSFHLSNAMVQHAAFIQAAAFGAVAVARVTGLLGMDRGGHKHRDRCCYAKKTDARVIRAL